MAANPPLGVERVRANAEIKTKERTTPGIHIDMYVEITPRNYVHITAL